MEAKQGERLQDQVVSAVGQVGARITDFLAGNPLESDVGKLIVAATTPNEGGEDWGLIMSICDYIAEVPNGGRDALRAIRRLLADNVGKNNQTILLTLTVLEAAVKNCGTGFASLVCKNEFLEELIKLVKKETPPAVQEQVLALIQAWADVFRNVPDCGDIGTYYDNLKAKGIEFPATDLDTLAPIVTPKRSQPGIYVASSPQQPIIDETAVAKIQNEIEVARKHANGFLALLNDLPPFESITEQDLRDTLNNVYKTTKEMRERTALLVQQIYENQPLVVEILDCTDTLTNAINVYETLVKASSPTRPPPQPQPQDPNAPGSSRSFQRPAAEATGDVFDQTNAGLNVAAFNKTEPITDRVAQELEDWLIDDKKPAPEKKDDGL
uniref:VHS domain-containing protein n=1 Tax=Panagrellus redivivus TaxID=6233 RepID=A0A7E4V008_PANRE